MNNRWINDRAWRINKLNEFIEDYDSEINCYEFLVKSDYSLNKTKNGKMISQLEMIRILKELDLDDSN